MKNLAKAIGVLPHVLVFDNSDLGHPFRKVAAFEHGKATEKHAPLPPWPPRTGSETGNR